MSDQDEIVLLIHVSEDSTEYTLTVRRADGGVIDSHTFIMEIEMWLHEIAQAEIKRTEPGTSLH